MITTELYKVREDGVKLYRTYSTENKYIRKIGTTEIYSEAVDIEGATYEYVETDKEIEKIEEI